MKNDIQGITSVLLAATIYGFLGVLSRLIGFDLPVFYQQIVRYFFTLIILVPIIWHIKSWKPIRKKDWKWILLRGISGLVSFLGIYVAFLYTDFSTVYFVSYSSATIGGYLLGKILFQEKFTPIRLLSLLMALLGLYLVYPTSTGQNEGLFILILLIAGFATAGWTVISRKVAECYSTLQTVILDYLIGFTVLLGLSLATQEKWIAPSFHTAWFYLGLLLVIQIATNFLIVYGFQRVDAYIGSLILLFDIVVGIILGAIFFSEYPSSMAVMGGGMIMVAMAFPHILEIRKSLKSKDT